MAHSGWGAVGGGAWGSAPQPGPEDDDGVPPPPQPKAKQFAFGANAAPGTSFRANPVAQPSPSFAQPAASSTGGNGFFGGAFGGSAASNSARGPVPTEAELRKREAELDAREAAVRQQEKELGVTLTKPNNWPRCYPVWRHNITEDIPEGSRRVVREAYFCWMCLVVALSYQFFCASVMLGNSGSGSAKVPSWFLTIIYWICGVPGGIWLWYKRLYTAAATDATFGFLSFFFFFFVHWAFCVWCAVGLQINAARWSFSGFLAGIDAFNVSTFGGIVYMIGGGVWSALAVYSMWVLKDAWFFFRGKGGVKEVQQAAAKEAALAAFRSQQQGNASARV